MFCFRLTDGSVLFQFFQLVYIGMEIYVEHLRGIFIPFIGDDKSIVVLGYCTVRQQSESCKKIGYVSFCSRPLCFKPAVGEFQRFDFKRVCCHIYDSYGIFDPAI